MNQTYADNTLKSNPVIFILNFISDKINYHNRFTLSGPRESVCLQFKLASHEEKSSAVVQLLLRNLVY